MKSNKNLATATIDIIEITYTLAYHINRPYITLAVIIF